MLTLKNSKFSKKNYHNCSCSCFIFATSPAFSYVRASGFFTNLTGCLHVYTFKRKGSQIGKRNFRSLRMPEISRSNFATSFLCSPDESNFGKPPTAKIYLAKQAQHSVANLIIFTFIRIFFEKTFKRILPNKTKVPNVTLQSFISTFRWLRLKVTCNKGKLGTVMRWVI